MENPFPKLMKRKVVQWATGYAAVGFALVEILDIVGGRFHWPEAVLEGGIVVVAYGLLVTLVLAWFHGEKGRQRAGGLEVFLLVLILVGCVATLWLVRGEGEEEKSPLEFAEPRLAPEFTGPPEPNAARIAVLPFDNLSALGEADAYLADGLHDEIITQISKINALEVVSRTSVMRYRDPGGRSAIEIGEELGVWYLLEGSLRRIGDQVRVTAQLIDTRTDGHLWAETYDGVPNASTLFDLQSDVALQVARALQAALLPSEITRIEQAYTQNDQAYWSYLQGLRVLRGYASVNVPRALEDFRNAVELDPDFAVGWEALAQAYVSMGNYFLAPPQEVFPLAEAAALRALELAPTLTSAKVSLAWVQFSYLRDWDATERILREVLGENRTSFYAHYLLAYYLQAMGRYGEAAHEGRLMTGLDPTSGASHRAAARMLHIGRWFEEAEKVMRWAMELTPSATGGFLYLALTLEQMGRLEEAVSALQKAALGAGEDPAEVGGLESRFAAEGMEGVWSQWLEWQLAGEEPRPGPVAIGYARLGDAQGAVEWLNRGVGVYESWLFQLNDPLWDPVRGSAGFQDLLQRLGLPQSPH